MADKQYFIGRHPSSHMQKDDSMVYGLIVTDSMI